MTANTETFYPDTCVIALAWDDTANPVTVTSGRGHFQ
jgi:hypothetical protein